MDAGGRKYSDRQKSVSMQRQKSRSASAIAIMDKAQLNATDGVDKDGKKGAKENDEVLFRLHV